MSRKPPTLSHDAFEKSSDALKQLTRVSTDIESTAEEEEKDQKYSSGVSTAKYTGAWFSQPSHAKPLEKGTTERFKEAQKLEEEVGVKKASVLRREKRKEQEQ